MIWECGRQQKSNFFSLLVHRARDQPTLDLMECYHVLSCFDFNEYLIYMIVFCVGMASMQGHETRLYSS